MKEEFGQDTTPDQNAEHKPALAPRNIAIHEPPDNKGKARNESDSRFREELPKHADGEPSEDERDGPQKNHCCYRKTKARDTGESRYVGNRVGRGFLKQIILHIDTLKTGPKK